MTRIFRFSLSIFTIAGTLFISQIASVIDQQLGAEAYAQEAASPPIILIINQAVLLSESKAGKDVAEQAQALSETITKELKDEFDSIKKDEESLLAQQTLLAPEVLRQRAEDLQVRKQNFDVHQQVKNREFQASVQNARAEIAKALEPILTEIIEQRSATLMLDRSAVMFSTPDIDVTPEVMKKLDDKLKKVKVKRVKIEVKENPENNQ